jgi:hypothetical protein
MAWGPEVPDQPRRAPGTLWHELLATSRIRLEPWSGGLDIGVICVVCLLNKALFTARSIPRLPSGWHLLFLIRGSTVGLFWGGPGPPASSGHLRSFLGGPGGSGPEFKIYILIVARRQPRFIGSHLIGSVGFE